MIISSPLHRNQTCKNMEKFYHIQCMAVKGQYLGTNCNHWNTRWMFPKIGGKPPKWMVYFMENTIKMDDLGVPLFLETPRYLTLWVPPDFIQPIHWLLVRLFGRWLLTHGLRVASCGKIESNSKVPWFSWENILVSWRVPTNYLNLEKARHEKKHQ